MRRAWLVVVLGGCDVVFGIEERPGAPTLNAFESTTHDEDGDGTPDAFDLCPHRPRHTDLDADADGIGDDCDPRKDLPDQRYFFAFAGGDIERLSSGGILETSATDDAVYLGAIDDALSYLRVDDVSADAFDVEVDFTIVASDRAQPTPIGPYSEVGIATTHRSYLTGDAERGDVCFGGSDAGTPPNYLEFDQDAADLDALTKRFTGTLLDTRLRFGQTATPAGFGCVLQRGAESIANTHARPTARTERGTLAIGAVRVRARIDSLWLVVPE